MRSKKTEPIRIAQIMGKWLGGGVESVVKIDNNEYVALGELGENYENMYVRSKVTF